MKKIVSVFLVIMLMMLPSIFIVSAEETDSNVHFDLQLDEYLLDCPKTIKTMYNEITGLTACSYIFIVAEHYGVNVSFFSGEDEIEYTESSKRITYNGSTAITYSYLFYTDSSIVTVKGNHTEFIPEVTVKMTVEKDEYLTSNDCYSHKSLIKVKDTTMVNCRYMIWTDWNCGREVEAEFFFNGTKIEDVTVEKRSVSEIYIYTYSFIVDQSLGDEVTGRVFTKPSESKSDQPTTPTEPAIEKINKKINPMKVSTAVKTVKYSKITKTKQTVAPITVKKAKGKVNYKRVSGSKKLALKANGKIVVKKGTKKGTYSIKVKVTAQSTSKYKSKKITVIVKIRVK